MVKIRSVRFDGAPPTFVLSLSLSLYYVRNMYGYRAVQYESNRHGRPGYGHK